MIELVDFNEVYLTSVDTKKKSTRRRKQKKSVEDNIPDTKSEKKAESDIIKEDK